jgi:type VII secretion integral membrane protein EccD
LTVHGGGDDGSPAVDLALPRDADVGLLMPSIVDLVRRDTGPAPVGRWRLARIGGSLLDESMTLHENNVRDGDLLVLTTGEAPTLRWVWQDPHRMVADAIDNQSGPAPRIIAVAAMVCAAGIGAAALWWSGLTTRGYGHLVTGALVAAAAAVGAVAQRRAKDTLPCAALSVVAAVYAALVGFLAVPAGPSAANGLLAATAALSTAIVLLRLTRCGTPCLTAVATCAALAAATAAICVAWIIPVEAAGALLVVLSLTVLGLAARLSIMVAGLTPELPAASEEQVALAHQTTTGLVIGSSAAAALGGALVACGSLDGGRSPLCASLFTAVVGLVLLLRARTHSAISRQIALSAGVMVSVAAALAVTVISAPGQAHWATLLTAVVGAAALGWLHGYPVSPVLRRSVEVLEYLSLAAVLPLACWVVGLYGLVRGLSLA